MSSTSWGYSGKLPVFGDFIRKNIPPSVAEKMNDVCHALAVRVATHPDWKKAYLVMPFWSFNLPHCMTFSGPYCGCIMPSVDQHGRYFPFYILARGSWRFPDNQKEIEELCHLMGALLRTDIALAEFEAKIHLIHASDVSADIHNSCWWAQPGSTSFTCLWPEKHNLKMMLGLT